MKRIVVTVDDDSSVLKVIESIKHIDEVKDVFQEYEESPEVIQMLEERWKNYKANPTSVIDFEALKQELKRKYGI